MYFKTTHMIPTPDLDPSHLEFASDYVAEKVLARIMEYNMQELEAFVEANRYRMYARYSRAFLWVSMGLGFWVLGLEYFWFFGYARG